jgi:hypothetical protein
VVLLIHVWVSLLSCHSRIDLSVASARSVPFELLALLMVGDVGRRLDFGWGSMLRLVRGVAELGLAAEAPDAVGDAFVLGDRDEVHGGSNNGKYRCIVCII